MDYKKAWALCEEISYLHRTTDTCGKGPAGIRLNLMPLGLRNQFRLWWVHFVIGNCSIRILRPNYWLNASELMLRKNRKQEGIWEGKGVKVNRGYWWALCYVGYMWFILSLLLTKRNLGAERQTCFQPLWRGKSACTHRHSNSSVSFNQRGKVYWYWQTQRQIEL